MCPHTYHYPSKRLMHPALEWAWNIVEWITTNPDLRAPLITALALFVLAKAIGFAVHITMPSTFSNSPFLSLKPDSACGRTNGHSSKSFSSLSGTASPTTNGANGYSHTNGNGYSNGYTNGHANGHQSPAPNDEFLRLDAPQQDLLLLHGPRQKYKLEKSKEIPDLKGDREILIQVLAIGLNPVDWKGADYGFSQPSYPWINGRDFAGIVVRAPRNSSRIQQGDVVFGPSTDYRDVRKAAYQEYVVTTDYNVTRIPQGVSVKEGAALGVAYVAATVALGISFGLDLTNLRNGPRGPDLFSLTKQLDPRDVPEDIRNEIFGGIAQSERPQPGEWLAIWGANSMTGQLALQIAKLAGLKVACIADIARGGARLSELGADFLVDKYDDKRAVDILKAVTGGKLRFGIDCNGKDSATSLQDALTQSDGGLNSHLLGLTGLPKSVGRGVVHHQVPIKAFHEFPQVGEAMSVWLEDLLVAHALRLPEVEIAEGGLAGINDALDRMRTGTIGGKRVVVPVGEENHKREAASPANGTVPNGIGAVSNDHHDLSYADSLNSDPDRVRFAYWVPNVSGGLVISKIKQRTSWDLKSNVRYARIAEQVGFEYALSQIRFMAGYGADNQHEPVSFSQALLMSTERLKVIAALLPGPWNPAVAAKQIASIDNYCEGRVCVNVVSGWFRAEFASIGQWWLDHAERYRRSKEFIQCLKGIWTNEKFSFKGDFYQFHDYPLKPKPLNLPGRPYPEIFQGGNSDDAKENAGSVSDYYFMNGNTLEGFQSQIGDVKERAKKNDREGQVGFALNAFVICRETEEEAIRVLQEIQGKADAEAVEGFRRQVQNAGSSTSNKSGMWANSKFEDLVQYNDGFKTKLIGTKEQIAERIVLLKSLGVNIILTAFLHYEEEIEQFGREVLPLVRKLEAQGRGKNTDYEISLTGDVYRAKNQDKK
ncbi:FMNH(2)-dependent dimethylsulfone monooxygenase [Pseudocercospora fuligena]|uniref:FMNH(2)-dependent dimethylsulfone monooxygenase n=1 Tax=Pseudocercospora fuligena TaxID=685502 RepID=A0A8H6RJF5_9PEZI|nr:FMNH(2)-dependent dimethylsulfone monooxygenase [Pseudocercospora fuligena]